MQEELETVLIDLDDRLEVLHQQRSVQHQATNAERDVERCVRSHDDAVAALHRARQDLTALNERLVKSGALVGGVKKERKSGVLAAAARALEDGNASSVKQEWQPGVKLVKEESEAPLPTVLMDSDEDAPMAANPGRRQAANVLEDSDDDVPMVAAAGLRQQYLTNVLDDSDGDVPLAADAGGRRQQLAPMLEDSDDGVQLGSEEAKENRRPATVLNNCDATHAHTALDKQLPGNEDAARRTGTAAAPSSQGLPARTSLAATASPGAAFAAPPAPAAAEAAGSDSDLEILCWTPAKAPTTTGMADPASILRSRGAGSPTLSAAPLTAFHGDSPQELLRPRGGASPRKFGSTVRAGATTQRDTAALRQGGATSASGALRLKKIKAEINRKRAPDGVAAAPGAVEPGARLPCSPSCATDSCAHFGIGANHACGWDHAVDFGNSCADRCKPLIRGSVEHMTLEANLRHEIDIARRAAERACNQLDNAKRRAKKTRKALVRPLPPAGARACCALSPKAAASNKRTAAALAGQPHRCVLQEQQQRGEPVSANGAAPERLFPPLQRSDPTDEFVYPEDEDMLDSDDDDDECDDEVRLRAMAPLQACGLVWPEVICRHSGVVRGCVVC